MLWRILTFCVLVSLILMVVLSYIHGRPVVHLFFKRCCDDGIENEEVIFENFADNFLREKLVAAEEFEKNRTLLLVAVEEFETNGTLLPPVAEVAEFLKMIRYKINAHDPDRRTYLEEYERIFLADLDSSNVTRENIDGNVSNKDEPGRATEADVKQ